MEGRRGPQGHIHWYSIIPQKFTAFEQAAQLIPGDGEHFSSNMLKCM